MLQTFHPTVHLSRISCPWPYPPSHTCLFERKENTSTAAARRPAGRAPLPELQESCARSHSDGPVKRRADLHVSTTHNIQPAAYLTAPKPPLRSVHPAQLCRIECLFADCRLLNPPPREPTKQSKAARAKKKKKKEKGVSRSWVQGFPPDYHYQRLQNAVERHRWWDHGCKRNRPSRTMWLSLTDRVHHTHSARCPLTARDQAGYTYPTLPKEKKRKETLITHGEHSRHELLSSFAP
ncbi:hypothetical protein BC835DRAFT_185067 [Cytidiella melzeri]|nr:hypothetical protein BC835DRAFT_185067 [Cytidiella melzeri]